jgi:hypothetical protein
VGRFTGTVLRRLLGKPLTWVLIALFAVGAGVGLYWFQPWRLVTTTTVNEALAEPRPAASAGAAPVAGPRLLRQGAFITHEHHTSGGARIVEHPDGRRQLELVGLATSDGPDLRVWLTDQPVREGPAGWRVFDDGAWLELGRLKGNRGNQVYEIPPGTDLDRYRSVSIWCRRFAVSFGAAELS